MGESKLVSTNVPTIYALDDSLLLSSLSQEANARAIATKLSNFFIICILIIELQKEHFYLI